MKNMCTRVPSIKLTSPCVVLETLLELDYYKLFITTSVQSSKLKTPIH